VAVTLEELQEGEMSTIGPVSPAYIVVSQAEVGLVADKTAKANAATITSRSTTSRSRSRRRPRKANTFGVILVT
jgi:succinyl-CoA synthetase alpha subunit